VSLPSPMPEAAPRGADHPGVDPLADARVRLAEAAMAFNRYYVELARDDADGAAARLQLALDMALDRVDEAARACEG
jgi:hypothetical protein